MRPPQVLEEGETYQILAAPAALEGRAFRCFLCGLVSYHPEDGRYRYCGHCHYFHERSLPAQQGG